MDFQTADRPTLERMLHDPRFGEPLKDRIRARLATLPVKGAEKYSREYSQDYSRDSGDTAGRVLSAAPAKQNRSPSTSSENERLFQQALLAQPGALALTLWGPPRTKKTSNRLMMHAGRMKVVPSEAWCAWRDAIRETKQVPESARLPDRPYRCTALFYRQSDTGDLVGFQQGLADVLEEMCVISNDRFIRSWDGTRLLVDRACPRVEIILSPMED